MSERGDAKARFLRDNGLDPTSLVPLDQDASTRCYYRACDPDRPVLLMEVVPAEPDLLRAVTAMTDWLAGQACSVPQIHAQDPDAGYMLIEDFGDALFARVLRQDPALEGPLYEAAIDVLAQLHRALPCADIPRYDWGFLAFELDICTTWYAPMTEDRRSEFTALFAAHLADEPDLCDTVVLRDFHAENLFWLPERQGLARVGLIDFQDARLGHKAYDFVSLLGDVRRDVDPQLGPRLRDRFCEALGYDNEAFARSATVLSAQRNLKILGIFARLAIRDHRDAHLALLPRVWRNLMHDLSHPALATLANFVENHIPPPTKAHVASIRQRAAA